MALVYTFKFQNLRIILFCPIFQEQISYQGCYKNYLTPTEWITMNLLIILSTLFVSVYHGQFVCNS